jgi:hypothetical protein
MDAKISSYNPAQNWFFDCILLLKFPFSDINNEMSMRAVIQIIETNLPTWYEEHFI